MGKNKSIIYRRVPTASLSAIRSRPTRGGRIDLVLFHDDRYIDALPQICCSNYGPSTVLW